MKTLLCLLAPLALLAPHAAAQDEKQVLADFKAAVKPVLKTFKQGATDAGKTLDDALSDFSSRFDELAGSDAPIDDLLTALQVFQAALHTAQVQAATDVGTAGATATAALTPGGADDNVYPVGLVNGDGGELDDAQASIAATADKAVAAADKKLAKLAKTLRKKTDMRLSVLLRSPQPLQDVVLPGGLSASFPHSLAIDILATFNRGGADDDGRAWIGGSAGINEGDVHAIIETSGTSAIDDISPDINERWLFATNVLTDPLPEGNYLAVVRQGDGAADGQLLGLQ